MRLGELKNFRNKKPIVIVTGCVAQAEGEILLNKEKYIDAVLGPQSFHNINETISNFEKKPKELIILSLMLLKNLTHSTKLKILIVIFPLFLQYKKVAINFVSFALFPIQEDQNFHDQLMNYLMKPRIW